MQQAIEFCTALAENDQNTIVRMIESKVSITATYYSQCGVENCDAKDCTCGKKACVRSFILDGNANPEALRFLLDQGYINTDVVCRIINDLFLHTSNLQKYDTCIEVFFDYLDSKDVVRQAAIAYRDEVRSTLFHFVFHSQDYDRVGKWAARLFSMGFDPYAQNGYCRRPLDTIVERLFVKLAEQTVNPEVVNYCEYDEFWRGANLLQRILKRYATEKDPETLVKVRQMVKILLDANINLEFVTLEGINTTDYLTQFKWMNTDVGLLFYGKYIPVASGNKIINPFKCLDAKLINPSPFAYYMHKERYTKGQNDRLANEIRALVAIHGVPTPLEWIAHGECGEICAKCGDRRMCGFDSLEELSRKFGFSNIEAVRLIDPSYT